MTALALVRTANETDVAEEIGSGFALTVRGLTKSFGSQQVLRGIDLHIPPGQFVAVVGRSGCGKSTLLRLLLGLDKPDSGGFWFGDHGAGTDQESATRVMFQEPRLLPWARALQNVQVGLGRQGSHADRRGRASAALRAVGLEERAGAWPAVLSGGQKQRVALARALVSEPKFMAFDEPLGALDALTRISMQRLIEQVWKKQRFTAIMVTHDVAEAVALADRVLLIEAGRIAMDIPVNLPRPRERGAAAEARLVGQILDQILGGESAGADA